MKYYLHDTSAFDDEKVSELYINFGYEGVGLFYVILEKLGKQEKPVKTSVLKSQLRIGKKLERCWSFMESIGLISSNNGETFNKQLLNFSEKYQIKKEKNTKRISEWRKNQLDSENVTCYENVCNTHKVKESKVNETKVNIDTSTEVLAEKIQPPPTEKIDFKKIIESYHTICTRLPQIRLIDENLKKKIKARAGKIDTPQKWEYLFKKLQNSNFCAGENKNSWVADFRWLVENDKNWIKLSEGRYDNRVEKSVEITDPNQFRKDGGFGTL